MIAFLLLLLGSANSLKNLDVHRIIDVRTPIVRIEHQISLSEPTAEYEYHVHPSESERVSLITASHGRTNEPLDVQRKKGTPNIYLVKTNKLPKTDLQFKIFVALTNTLEAKPAEIVQAQTQFVKYTGDAYLYSPYVTDKQTTKFILPKGEILRYTPSPEPVNKQSGEIVYGPYSDIKAFSHSPLHVHFENNRPFLTVKSMTRWIEISHWGNIAVEESLEIKNMGAKLKGSFSRLDFDMGIGQKAAVTSFKTALPAAAKDIYYRDQIGNISTSSVVEALDAVEVRLAPRFPLMGGWKTEYTIGYNIPAHQFLYRDGSKFTLRMRFMDHIYDEQVVENLVLKIVLPELASDIEFIPPFPVTEHPQEVLKTYLDTVGRTVLVYSAKNLVTEHILDFTLNYKFNMLLMFREPLMLITAFCVIFACVLIYVRLDFSIFRDEKTELRMRAQAIVDEAQDLYKRRTMVYQSFEDTINRFKSGKDGAQLSSDRRKLDAEYKEINQAFARVQASLSELCAESAEKLKEVMALDVAYRELIQESIQQAERVVSGKITKHQYQTADSDMSVKKAELIGRMDNAMESL